VSSVTAHAVLARIGLAALTLFLASPFSSAQVRPWGIRITPEAAQKHLKKQVDPVYTAEMRRNHAQGAVKLQIRLSEKGDVQSAQLVSGNRQLASAAIDAVKQWKYDPYLLGGVPIRFETIVRINFSPSRN